MKSSIGTPAERLLFKNLSDMNILISGIHGFVGSNLTTYFKQNHTIYGLDIVFPDKDGVTRTFSWENLEQIPNVDTIIHLAGKAHDTKNTSLPEEYFRINVGLTKVIFDQFLKSDASKFIYFSSVKAVADSVKNDVLTENDTPDPQTPYGQSKLEAEEYILSRELPEGKKVYILRPAMIHGPGNKGNLNLLYKFVAKGIPYPLGAFSNQRSFMSIGNLNFIIEQLIQKDIQSGIFQVADSEPLSTNEIIDLIAKSMNKKPSIWNIPIGLIQMAARLGDILPLPLNSEKVKKLTENYIVSNKKIAGSIGASLPISAKEGMKSTLNSFKG